MSKLPAEERRIIVGQPEKRPYGALLCIHAQTSGALGRAEEVGFSLTTGAFVTVAPTRVAPWEGGKKYLLRLEGFSTATAAEAAGRRLAQSVLWMAISTDVPLRLEYQSYEPVRVFDRNRSEGLRAEGYGEASYRASVVIAEIQEAYTHFPEAEPRVLLSMEIFSGARLEASDRARFLAVVSALEPLAAVQPLGTEVDGFVATCISNLSAVPAIAGRLRRSLEGRLRELGRESVRQALHRTIDNALPGRPDVVAVIDEAYALRSEIIHGGRPADLDVDLQGKTGVVSSAIREIYATLLGRPLVAPMVQPGT